jgi:hypothetical protein
MSVKAILCFLGISLFFLQCKKDDTRYQGYFYSKNPTKDVQLTLYLDGQIQGQLPYVKTDSLGFTSDSIKTYSMKINVAAGKHKVEAKDQHGTTRSSGSFKVTKNKTSSSGSTGGQELVLENSELRVGISF